MVLVAEVSAGVWSYSYQDELKDLIKRSVKDTVINDYGKIESRTQAFDSVQTEVIFLSNRQTYHNLFLIKLYLHKFQNKMLLVSN